MEDPSTDRAPARFLLELKRKAEAVGGVYAEVDTKEFKASQYNHVTDTYEKIPLSQREKEIGNRKVQRDLYSAVFNSKCRFGF